MRTVQSLGHFQPTILASHLEGMTIADLKDHFVELGPPLHLSSYPHAGQFCSRVLGSTGRQGAKWDPDGCGFLFSGREAE